MEEWDIAIKEAVDELGESFDSHDIIKKVAHLNQRKYVLALSELDSDTPFQQLHSALGRRIKPVCEQLGYVGQDSRSPDMFDQSSKCQQWSR
ncbi:hypothetical protein HWQ46_05930 [Shewanella sp. D64]|uniref:hypothetical protein n=1 Tax=unclassified Shewanella TaxID=196818 RepID=UPI0022BA43C4|nr:MULTISPECIES: hypothetical protein [unclassified Shewanella]MEC4725091.1 hypothetical protein [Shewanella sp. D64]MEC4736992.1 hypothetical protein [Shewanella sp. E94]WBJ96580.1 hypothetical protein HWQ47_05535 [Shewanella sp. MTB7]